MPSSDFRITHQIMGRRVMDNLQRNMERLQVMQDQVSSQRRINRPSDSPSGAVSAMVFRADIGRAEQYARNMDDALGWLGTADGALSSMIEQVGRVRELALQGRNASMDATAREALAVEVEKIRDGLIGVANTKYLDRAIFGGTASGPAYAADGTYTGVSGVVERAIAAGVRIQVNVNGEDVFGAAGSDVFTVLEQLATALRNDPADLDGAVASLDARTTQMRQKLADVGTRYHRVEDTRFRNESYGLTLKQNLSEVEDVDLAKAIMDLRMQEVAYQAALQSTARVIQPSLVDFLR